MVLFPTAPQSTVSGALACRWREGSKCAPADQLLAARLHVSMRRPGVIAVGVRPTSHNCISLGRAIGLWASQLEFDQHLTTAYPQVTRAVSRWLCVDQHRPTVCTSHLSAFPEKKRLGFIVPRHAKLGKRLQLTGPFSSHLCRTRVSTFFCTCKALSSSPRTHKERTTGQRQTADLHRKPLFSLTRVRRRSVAHYTFMHKGDEEVRSGEQEDTFNAAVRPHGGPRSGSRRRSVRKVH